MADQFVGVAKASLFSVRPAGAGGTSKQGKGNVCAVLAADSVSLGLRRAFPLVKELNEGPEVTRVGNDDGSPTAGVTGGSLPAVLWRRVVERAVEGATPRPLPGGGDVIAEAGGNSGSWGGDDGGGFIARIIRSLTQATSRESSSPDARQTPPREPYTPFKGDDR